MINLESMDQFTTLKNDGKHIFLFSAEWCGDCRVIEPIIPSIETEYPDYTFIHIDRDKFIDLCVENDVFGIPSFIAFDNGKELGRFVSKDRKTEQEIKDFIESL